MNLIFVEDLFPAENINMQIFPINSGIKLTEWYGEEKVN